MKIYFATGNKGKAEEVEERLGSGFQVVQKDPEIHEISSHNVEKIAMRKVRDSREKLLEGGDIDENSILIVEDTALYVKALNGFPGTNAGYFDRTVGADSLLKLMEDEKNREAYFKSVFALYEVPEILTFGSEFHGTITKQKRGKSHPHLPYNSFFIPNGENETLAENPELKKRNHRNKAVSKLLDYLEEV